MRHLLAVCLVGLLAGCVSLIPEPRTAWQQRFVTCGMGYDTATTGTIKAELQKTGGEITGGVEQKLHTAIETIYKANGVVPTAEQVDGSVDRFRQCMQG